MLLVGILFSYSRGAWVNLAVALVVLGLILSLRGGVRTAATLLAVTGDDRGDHRDGGGGDRLG